MRAVRVDIISELRELALASRLTRLAEAMMSEVEDFYAELGFEFRPRWFPLFYTLSRRSPMGITELSRALGLSHPAVNGIAAEMLRAGLIVEMRDRRDDRRRLLRLTPKGRRVLARLRPVWKAIRAAAHELLDEAGVNLVGDLESVETTFAKRSVMDRVRERLSLPGRENLTIVEYRPAYKKHFRRLNEEWLEKYFFVDKRDAELLADPNRRIVKRGGAVLFALLDGEVVGACALLRHDNGVHELCKMAVTPGAQRRGIGMALAEAVIARARALGARELFLQTSPRLKGARQLYRRLGFRRTERNPLACPGHERCTIAMRLDLTRMSEGRGKDR